MRDQAIKFVKALIEKMYGDIDNLDSQISINEQEDPTVAPILESVQEKLREALRVTEEASVDLENLSDSTQ